MIYENVFVPVAEGAALSRGPCLRMQSTALGRGRRHLRTQLLVNFLFLHTINYTQRNPSAMLFVNKFYSIKLN